MDKIKPIKVGIYGTCRVSRLISDKIERVNDRLYNNRKYSLIVQPTHYTTSVKETIQAVDLTFDPSPLEELSDEQKKDIFFYVTQKKLSAYVPIKPDAYIIEICSIKNITATAGSLTIPYKPFNKNIQYETKYNKDIKPQLEILLNKIGNDVPVILIGPLLLKNLIEKTLNTRKYICNQLIEFADSHPNVQYLDLTKYVYKVGYERTMVDQFHFNETLIKIYTKEIMNWIEKKFF